MNRVDVALANIAVFRVWDLHFPKLALCRPSDAPHPDSDSAADSAEGPMLPIGIDFLKNRAEVAPPLRLLRHWGRSVYAWPPVTLLGG